MDNDFEIKFYNSLDSLNPSLRDDFLKLHTVTFNEAYTDELLQELPRRLNVLLCFAIAKGNLIGFKTGYEMSPGAFYSWSGAVSPKSRKQGVGSALMKAQHEWCKSHGFNRIQTKTKNKWKDMIVLNVRSGFDIIGSYTDEKGEPKLILEKKL